MLWRANTKNAPDPEEIENEIERQKKKNFNSNLSVEEIKKDIVYKLSNNISIVSCFDVDKYIKECNTESLIDAIRVYIFDNDIFDISHRKECYIAVEVEEHEVSLNKSYYHVMIKIKLDDIDKMSKVSSIIKNIITELYPNREKYSNVPFRPETQSYEYDAYHRMITFDVK